jgi:hypothetical protein
MKKIICSILLSLAAVFQMSAMALQYDRGSFPDELSMEGLPEAIPCKMNKVAVTGGPDVDVLLCTWMAMPRQITEWIPDEGRHVTYFNRRQAVCRKGVCRVKGKEVGTHPEDVTLLLSLWYYIGQSTDGKPVAYRFGAGPNAGMNAVSYVQAGQMLVEFYENSGIDHELAIMNELELHYIGGSKQFQADLAGGQPAAQVASFGEIKEAWCNPRLDDSCSINGNPVPKADLPKYLPLLDPSVVESNGGSCEYPICYDSNYKPIGVSKLSYK